MSEFIIIAVDGGAASGKSSTSKILSEKLDLLHVDTGLHYRTLTRMLLNADLDPTEEDKIKSFLQGTTLETQIVGRSAQIAVNRTPFNISELRTSKVNSTVSHFASIANLRNFLLQYQRSQAIIAKEKGFAGLIMEGRDIGSVIFPDADFKFFLFADESTRTARRKQEGGTDYIKERDRIDSSRKAAPLTCPGGAVSIDTSTLTLEKVAQKMIDTIGI